MKSFRLEWKFSNFLQKSPVRLSKLQSRYKFEYSDEKIFWIFLHHLRTLSETVWSVFRNFSGGVIKTGFYKSRGSIYWRKFLVEKIVSSFFFRLKRHFFGILLKVFWRCCQNCKQHVQWNLLRADIFCGSIVFSYIFSRHWAEPFWPFFKFFVSDIKTGCYVSIGIIWWKIWK